MTAASKPILPTPPPIVPPSPPVIPPAPKIVQAGSTTTVHSGPKPTPADETFVAAPATVESTWRGLATALGISAPTNLARARRAIRSIPGSTR